MYDFSPSYFEPKDIMVAVEVGSQDMLACCNKRGSLAVGVFKEFFVILPVKDLGIAFFKRSFSLPLPLR
jgi:hypothetical protein